MRQIAIRLNLIIVILLLATCGASHREKTIKTALTSVNTARDAFIVLDDKIQAAIVDACDPPACTAEMGSKQLIEYRLKREPWIKAFEAAYRAIATVAAIESAPLQGIYDTAREVLRALEEMQSYSGGQK